jgi:hypothetical protein
MMSTRAWASDDVASAILSSSKSAAASFSSAVSRQPPVAIATRQSVRSRRILSSAAAAWNLADRRGIALQVVPGHLDEALLDCRVQGSLRIGDTVAPQDLLEQSPVGDVRIRRPVAIDDDAQHPVYRFGIEPAVELRGADEGAIDVEHHQLDHAVLAPRAHAACTRLS